MLSVQDKPGIKLLRLHEAAEVLAISPRALWERSRRGEIPVVCIGRSRRYRLSDVEAYVAGLAEGTADAAGG